MSLRFRGREAAHQEMGRALMRRIITDVAGKGEAEKPPSKEGPFMNMVLTPK